MVEADYAQSQIHSAGAPADLVSKSHTTELMVPGEGSVHLSQLVYASPAENPVSLNDKGDVDL